MRAEEILTELDIQYPDSIQGIETKEELDERKVQRKLINHIRLMTTPQPKKDK